MPADDDGLEHGLETHEWVSFVDGDGDTWLFDLTFLTSRWTCLFGQGCPGILETPTPELEQGCCSYGAHFTGPADLARVKEAASRLTPDQWKNHRPVDTAFGGDDEEPTSVVVDGACIFHNPPGFAGGTGCALHGAAVEAEERPLDWKPEVCWQLPLRLDYVEDENGLHTYTLREWKRRDWGAGGDEFHWWCTTSDEQAFIGDDTVFASLSEEITEMVGPHAFAWLENYLVSRGTERLVPHPVRRNATS